MAETSTTARRRHEPGRRPSSRWRAAAGGLALATALSVVGTAASSPYAAPHGPASSHDTTISLSGAISVAPGDPVTMEVLKDKVDKELAGKGAYGQGIDVALIDSGVTPVAGLDQPGKIINGPDLSNEGAFPNLSGLDTFGHGTHLAGIIAGDDGNEVVGFAPQSRIVSVKVAGATGETDVAQVIAAIDWVVEHKNDNGLNIRVLNLSLGVPGLASSAGDPLSAAVERAWHAGIVVVAAAGNRGHDAGGIDSPAISPYVIAVGSTVAKSSDGALDDLADWTSGGTAIREADVVSPGNSILSLRVPGSFLDQMHPNAVVDETYFRGTGTSQSAAVVSGFTAALLSRNPSLTPDQVKFLFESQAADLDKRGFVDGEGRLRMKDTAASLKTASLAPVQSHPAALPSSGLFGLTAPSGASWSGGEWNGASWSGGTWNGASWSGASWSGASWSSGVWSGASWSGASWSGASWSGASWSGASWSGASWSGASWSGASWSGASWSGASWSGESWS